MAPYEATRHDQRLAQLAAEDRDDRPIVPSPVHDIDPTDGKRLHPRVVMSTSRERKIPITAPILHLLTPVLEKGWHGSTLARKWIASFLGTRWLAGNPQRRNDPGE